MIKDILKKTGKLFIKPKNFIFLIGLLSLFFLIMSVSIYSKFHKQHFYANRLNNLDNLIKTSVDQRKKIKDFIDQKTSYDIFFIDNKLESLCFLGKEKLLLNKLLDHPAYENSLEIQNRLKLIDGNLNKLQFSEENIKSTNLVKETDESQINTIEIDEFDLENLLKTIENSPKNSPQLIIKKFILTKTKPSVFSLDMKILKREFFKK
ncbi:MAG: hypothetical protein WCT85_02615 [Parachlamydiales bacterium]|jgi:hypothetical protein